MQIVQSKNNIVEKVIRDKQGRLVSARFYIYENAGRIKARLIDFTYIETLKGSVLNLSSFIKEKKVQLVQVFEKLFTSPYFNTNILAFNGSKPRAPTK